MALRIGFIGAGNMAQALAKGFISAGVSKAEGIIVSSPKSDQYLLDQMSSLGCKTTYNNCDAVESTDVVILAVKPNIIPVILNEIKPFVTPKTPLVSSVALGVTMSNLESCLPPESRVIRIMPNTPALVQKGASVFCKGTWATEDDADIVRRLLLAVGGVDEVQESYLDAVTGLSGAGPAYVYLAVESLADGGVRMGLPRPLAQKLAAQTMMGAAKMVLDTGKHPGQLKDEVCSAGGCTIQGVAALEKGGLRTAFINAVQEATLRSIEISNNGG